MAVGGFSCQDKGMSGNDDKAERLARALRENLKRRKTQSRELQKPAEPNPPEG